MSSGLVAIIVLIVVAVGAAPIFYVFLWNARRNISRASEDAHARRRHGRLRLGFQLFVYGGIATFTLILGTSGLVRGQLEDLILVPLGLAYAAISCWAVLRHRRSGGQPASRPPV
jgi:hypothetical protein